MYSFTIFLLIHDVVPLPSLADTMLSGLNYNNHAISPTEWILPLFMAEPDEIWVHVCVTQNVSEYMHAFVFIHLHGQGRAGKWHAGDKPTRAVPYTCISVTLHCHLTPILQIPGIAQRGLAWLYTRHNVVLYIDSNNSQMMISTNSRISESADDIRAKMHGHKYTPSLALWVKHMANKEMQAIPPKKQFSCILVLGSLTTNSWSIWDFVLWSINESKKSVFVTVKS